jgi:hypothetical protein
MIQLHKTEQELIDEILEEFNFEKCKVVMDHLHWTWGFTNQVPSIQQLKESARNRIESAIEGLKGQEGIVVYFNNDQSLLKVKGAWYLALHRMKSELSSIDGIVDLYFSIGGNLSYDEFMKHITDVFDYELAKMIMGSVSKIVDSKKEVDRIVAHMESFVLPLKQVSRKDAALAIVKAYGETNRASFAFKLLDGHSLTEKEYKKLIFQCIR